MQKENLSTLLNMKIRDSLKGKEPGYIGLKVTKEEGKISRNVDTMQDNPEYVYGTIIYSYRNKSAAQNYSDLITQAFKTITFYKLVQIQFYFSQTEASSAKRWINGCGRSYTRRACIYRFSILKRKKVGAAYDEMRVTQNYVAT